MQPTCPRCDGFIPNNEQPGAYPGALSRTDNQTEICSACGQAEAMEQFANNLMPQSEWAAFTQFESGDAE